MTFVIVVIASVASATSVTNLIPDSPCSDHDVSDVKWMVQVMCYVDVRNVHSPLLLRLPRFFHFCQIYAGQLFVDQPIEVAL